jgi:uncharacterized protein (UPF0303 family)
MALDDDIRIIGEQEKRLRWRSFDAGAAWDLGCRLRDRAAADRMPVAIDITLHAMPVFYTALDGSSPDNARWVRRKRNVALHFLRSSYGIGRQLAQQGSSLQEKFALSDADYAAHGGSFPICVEGAGCIGAVTVSGLPQRDDHELVVAVLCEMLGIEDEGLRLPS